MHASSVHKFTGKHKKDAGKWALDVNLKHKEIRCELPSPPGYSTEKIAAHGGEAQQGEEGHSNVVDKRSWDTALAPIKGLPMNIFIMYMAGNTISIFPIMMVGMMFFRPIQALMGIRATMRVLSLSDQYIFQTFVYLLGNCMAVALAVYKCNSMGLLPTHPSDWLAFVEPLHRQEFIGGGFTM